MKKLEKLLDFFLVIIFAFLLIINYPQIKVIADEVLNNIDIEKISDTLSNASLVDINGIGKLVNDNSINASKGYTGEEYNFDTTYYPYYGIIDEKYQSIYKQVYANALNRNSSFAPVITIDKDEVKNVVEAVMFDHPELFWLDNEYTYKYNMSGNCIEIVLKFNNTINNFNEYKELFEEEANKIIEKANTYNTDLEKEKYVHDTLVKEIDYNEKSSLNQSAYSAIVNKESVCAGISKAFQYIMNELNIPTYYVTGKSDEDHAWNLVKIDNNYYNVDITWDISSGYKYAYFNKSDTDIYNHTRTGLSIYLPECYQSLELKNYH